MGIRSQHKNGHRMPFVLMGDFNQVLYLHKCQSRSKNGIRSASCLRDFMSHYGLVDFSAVGNLFTWMNNQVGAKATYECSDGAIVSTDWLNLFRQAVLLALPIQ